MHGTAATVSADGFDAFVLGHGRALLRTAVLLTGSRHDGEDVLQTVLVRMYASWPRIQDPLPYARTALVLATRSTWRWRSRHREVPLAEHDTPVPDRTECAANREQVLQALMRLPARQRAVLVLRFYEGLSEAEIAAVLRCSPGTVKSHASRGLTRLRLLLHDPTTTSDPAGGRRARSA